MVSDVAQELDSCIRFVYFGMQGSQVYPFVGARDLTGLILHPFVSEASFPLECQDAVILAFRAPYLGPFDARI